MISRIIKSRPTALLLVAGLCTMLLGGCLYPKENLAHNTATTREAVRNMNAVIQQYQEETGLLPIKNSPVDTPKYEKYVVDMAKLQRMQYISDLPGVSFEKGGNYYFLILDEETEPKIKLMDLVMYQKVNELQSAVENYYKINKDLPAAEQAYPGFYRIDYGKLGSKEPVIQSMFSGLTLSAMVDELGTVYVDYGIDLMRTVERSTDAKPEAGEDLREWLVRSSDFVPVKSPVYHWVNGEPQAVPAE
ncbi:hypothetical protein AB6A23_15285 [Paenibacillus tarimensis]